MPHPLDASPALRPTAADEGLFALFARTAASAQDRIFAASDGRALTLRALEGRSAMLAACLRAKDVAPGDRVALMLHNGEDALALMFAMARIGAIWVPIHTQAVGDNLAYVLSHAEPRVIVAEPELLSVIANCGANLRSASVIAVNALAAAATTITDQWSAAATVPAWSSADAPFAIMYTSGTTGRPKGVIVTHRMLRLAGEAAALVSTAQDGDVLYLWEPLYHIGGAQMIVLPLIRNVTLVLAKRFSASRFWADIGAAGATHMHFLGGILQILLQQPPGPLDRSHKVRVAWGGGCPREVWSPFEARFGVKINECYGMTECASFTTANLNGRVGSVGTPLPWFDVALVDAAGQPVAAGECGEIVVRERLPGAVTPGYFKDPDATAKALRNGAFHTGDLAFSDTAGNLYFHGRMTDSVRVRGENVTAAEVEDVASKHPAIEACVMIGVAASEGEGEIKLFVKLKPGMKLAAAELSAWLAPNLARYQRPRYIAIVEEFERTPSERIMKHKLSQRTDDAWDGAVDRR